jgi:hypothetical protein
MTHNGVDAGNGILEKKMKTKRISYSQPFGFALITGSKWIF